VGVSLKWRSFGTFLPTRAEKYIAYRKTILKVNAVSLGFFIKSLAKNLPLWYNEG
jgi:hypothetical protein